MKKIIKILDKIVEISIYCLIFIIPFSIAGIEIFAIVAIIAWLIKQVTSYKLQVTSYFPKTPLSLPIFILFTVYFISMIFSVNISESLKGVFLKLGEYLLLFFISVDIFSKKENNNVRFKIFTAIIVLSTILLFLDGAFQWLTGYDFIRRFTATPKLRACFNNENDFAGYLIAILPILFCMAFILFKKLKIVARLAIKFGSIALFSAGVILLGKTFSRGAWLGYLISMGFLATAGFLFKENGKVKKVFGVLALLYICAPLIVGLIFIKPIQTRLVSLKDGFGASWARVYNWKEAISIIEDFPIFGTGPNTYTTVIHNYSISKITGSYPHNCYLHMVAEVGVLGLAVFLWVLWSFFRIGMSVVCCQKIVNGYRYILLGVMAGTLATLVHSFFDTNLFALKLVVLFWVMVGIGTSYIMLLKDKVFYNAP